MHPVLTQRCQSYQKEIYIYVNIYPTLQDDSFLFPQVFRPKIWVPVLQTFVWCCHDVRTNHGATLMSICTNVKNPFGRSSGWFFLLFFGFVFVFDDGKRHKIVTALISSRRILYDVGMSNSCLFVDSKRVLLDRTERWLTFGFLWICRPKSFSTTVLKAALIKTHFLSNSWK